MEVILKQDIKGLGYKDDKVTVRNGYGRNFLLPKGMAVLATESVKKMHTEILKQRAFKEDKLRKEATSNAEKLAGVSIKVGAKAGESGKIFGSVTNNDIAEALNAQGFDVKKSEVMLPNGPLKTIGDFPLTLTLHTDVKATITVSVLGDHA